MEKLKDPQKQKDYFAGIGKHKSYSKSDIVKIIVRIENHYYYFSRFLLTRILTIIGISERDASKMTL